MPGPCDACGRHSCAPDATVCGACRTNSFRRRSSTDELSRAGHPDHLEANAGSACASDRDNPSKSGGAGSNPAVSMTRADLLVALADTIAELRRDEATLRRVGTTAAVGAADDAAWWTHRCEVARDGLVANEPLATERARHVLARYGSAALRERLAGRVPPVEPGGAA